MKITEILKQGINFTGRNRKFLLILWSTNACLAVILSLPVYSMLIDNLGHSLLSDQLAVEFNYFWFVQFMSLYKTSLQQLPLIFYAVVGIYMLVQTLYFGGLVAVFDNIKKNHVSDFFYGGVRYWYRFMKVLIVSLFFFVIVFLIDDLISGLVTSIFEDKEFVFTEFTLRSLRYLILLFLIGVVTIISDYSKVSMAIDEEMSVRKGIEKAIIFIKMHFRIVFFVFVLVALMGGTASLIYNIVETYVPRTPYYFLILSFILQQMLIIFRLFIKMLFCSTGVIIYKDFSAEEVSAEIEESNIGVN
jgi:hypothetical protein